jgi:hypothetical protein
MSIKQWRLIADSYEILLPIPPSKYQIIEGKTNSVVDILNFGEIDLQGGRNLSKCSISSFFPSKPYGFYGEAFIMPQDYINKLRNIKNYNIVVNLMITESEVFFPVTISQLTWGEEDGTGDLYYSMDLIEHRTVTPNSSATSSATNVQASSTSNSNASSTLYGLEVGTYAYTVEEGDNLTKIAKWYYGDSSRYLEIATRNNIANPNLIYPNQVLYL